MDSALPPAPAATAAGFRGGEALPATAYLQTPAYSGADQSRGELLSLACQACHSLEATTSSPIGPNLHGIFGTLSATAEDFEYSPALTAAEIVWTPQALDAWLADPAEFLPGTTMAFSGYGSADDRRDLIAFLLHKTSVGND